MNKNYRLYVLDLSIKKQDTWFWKNCRSQRKREANICQTCPFRELIEIYEKETIQMKETRDE